MKHLILLILIICVSLLSGCAPADQSGTLKVAVLPVLDSLPVYVAQSEGYFEKHGVKVEIVPVPSAPERDQLMQAGQIDVMLNELVSTIIYNKESVKIVVLRFARTVTPQNPIFRILASKNSGITDVMALKGVPVAISEGTVIEYTTDRLLEKAGLTRDEIKKVSVPKIPDRMALLGAGELKAANMPDPLASLAIKDGAVNLIDDTAYPEISHSVWSFRKTTVSEHPEEVRKFLAALDEAIKDINADKGKWTGMLIDLKMAPQALAGSPIIPEYPAASVPSKEQYEDALLWVKGKISIQKDIDYAEMVDGSFLPK